MASVPAARSESVADYEESGSDSEEIPARAMRRQMRRQEASDEGEEEELPNSSDRRPSFSDEDIDDEGAPPPNEEVGEVEEEGEEEEAYEEEEEEEKLEEEEGEGEEDEEEDDVSYEQEEDSHSSEEQAADPHSQVVEVTHKPRSKAVKDMKDVGDSKQIAVEERKQAEPFVVPRSGAFYMHDDRFEHNSDVGSRRTTAGGRRLWEAKDSKPWVHDRFEELILQEESYRGQSSQRGGHFSGQGRSRGRMRGWGRGRTGYPNSRDNQDRFNEESSSVPVRNRFGRGRVLRRAKMDEYEDEKARIARQKSLASQSLEKVAVRSAPVQKPTAPSHQPTNKTLESIVMKNLISGSILNSASPPFYPTGALSQTKTGLGLNSSAAAISQTTTGLVNSARQSEPVYSETAERSVQKVPLKADRSSGSQMDRGMRSSSSTPIMKQLPVPANPTISRQTSIDSMTSSYESEMLRGVNPVPMHLVRTSASSAVQPKVGQSLPSVLPQQSGRILAVAQAAQPTQPQQLQHNPQLPKQGQGIQRQPAQSQTAGIVVSSSNKSFADSKASPSPLVTTVATTGSARSSQAANFQAGRGSLVYAASSTDALTNGLCGVVQLAGQLQGGLGMSAVGVASPGYSNQAQFGFGNSEVTWIPILAGGGSGVSSQYIAVDSGTPAVYYAQPAQLTSQSTALGMGGSEPKPASGSFKPPKNPGLNNDELGQRQSKPRRYSEMSFGQ